MGPLLQKEHAVRLAQYESQRHWSQGGNMQPLWEWGVKCGEGL